MEKAEEKCKFFLILDLFIYQSHHTLSTPASGRQQLPSRHSTTSQYKQACKTYSFAHQMPDTCFMLIRMNP